MLDEMGNICFHADLHSEREQTHELQGHDNHCFQTINPKDFLPFAIKVALLWKIFYHLDIAAKTSTLNFSIDWDLSFKVKTISLEVLYMEETPAVWGMIFLLA